MLISTTKELAEFCSRADGFGAVFVDTEFIREETYYPRLELIQLNLGGEIGLIDYPAIDDPSPLWELLQTDSMERVFHAGWQDLEILYQESGQPVRGIFDTQIAAAFLGFGEQISYADLVRNIAGAELPKGHTYSDWGRRPLSPEQISYAKNDVRYLPTIWEKLKERLSSLGRLEWAREEFSAMEDSAASDPIPREELYMRVKGFGSLNSRELAVLRELAIWRDDQAQKLNLPTRKVIRDEQLINIVRHAPKSVDALLAVRGFNGRMVDHALHELVEAVKLGLSVPKEQWPKRPAQRPVDPSVQVMVSLMQALVRARAAEERCAWALLANTADLEELAMHRKHAKRGDFKVISGWRYEMVGKDLLGLLSGEVTIALDPESGEPVIK